MEFITIGKIRNPHGVRGFLKFRAYSGETKHLLSLKSVIVVKNEKEIECDIESIKQNGKELLLKLKGIDTPEIGKNYSNCEIRVDRKYAAPLENGEFYYTDLCNCTLMYKNEVIGTVISVWDNNKTDYLEVKQADGKKVMVPFIDKFIGAVDTKKQVIELRDNEIII